VALSIQLTLSDETAISFVRFKVINNDTGEEEPIYLLRNIPHTYVPNTTGYTVMADCKSSKKMNNGKWKLRIIGDKNSKPKPAFELIAENLKNVQEFTGVYTPNKHMLLFR
jgi:hypothetical protein